MKPVMRDTDAEWPDFFARGHGCGDGHGTIAGWGLGAGYGDAQGLGYGTGLNPRGHGAAFGLFTKSVPVISSDARRTQRPFRCAGCIDEFECPIHGRRL